MHKRKYFCLDRTWNILRGVNRNWVIYSFKNMFSGYIFVPFTSIFSHHLL